MKYILALDQGTTSSRAILFDTKGNIISVGQKEFTQHFPKPGWVEHDPEEIWSSQLEAIQTCLESSGVAHDDIACAGITNQRETTIIWDKNTGKPIHNAIVWQDNRMSRYCDELIKEGHAPRFRKKTGLVINAYFSATKIRHILHSVDGAMERAQKGELAFGTVDSWLLWKLTDGKVHATDVTNASRTMIYNIHTLDWDSELLQLLDIPKEILPTVHPSDHTYGDIQHPDVNLNIPISGIAGDQQAALFGQQCTEPGMLKNTYGTGCFLIVNTGSEAVESSNNLLTTLAWKIGDEVQYALEGSVFIGGSVIQWLRDGLQIIDDAKESEGLATSIDDNDGVYLVPAFVGLGAPHWDPSAGGTLIGLTRGTSKAHICRAALESIAYQTRDVVDAMAADLGSDITELRVDGGAVGNAFLMQFQADILDTQVVVPKVMETTALGVAYLAGLGSKLYSSVSELNELWTKDRTYSPQMELDTRKDLYGKWMKAVHKSKGWND